MSTRTEQIKKKKEMPDIYVILTVFMIIVAALSYVVPAGKYDRTKLPNGREIVVAGTYKVMDATPVKVMDFVTAIPKGLEKAAQVVFLTLLVGGAVVVLQKIGVIDMGINMLIGKLGTRTEFLIPILICVFGTIAAFVGTPELAIAYIPIILPLMLRLGYDSMTAAATAVIPCTIGFAFGITAPATIGIGHMITHLPMFSGAWYRIIWLVIMMISVVAFVVRYSRKVKNDPTKSSMYEDDIKLRHELLKDDASVKEQIVYSSRMKIAGIATLVMFVGNIALILKFGLGFNAISGLFLVMAVIASVIAGSTLNTICNNYNEAMRTMLVGAMICGVARGVSVMLNTGNIMDTLVFHLAGFIQSLPSSITAVGIVLSQTVFNFLVPSGSGQMLVTLPILSPVADLVNMNQQVLVWASNVADGVSNIFFPTSGYFIASLVAARVDYIRWIKFYLPFFIYTVIMACIGAVIAQAISYGPF